MTECQNGSNVRSTDLHLPKMLRRARMAGLVKLRCSAGHFAEWPHWAGNVATYAKVLFILRHARMLLKGSKRHKLSCVIRNLVLRGHRGGTRRDRALGFGSKSGLRPEGTA